MKKTTLLSLFLTVFLFQFMPAQSIREYNYNVNNGFLGNGYNHPGNIIYPVGYSSNSSRTPVVFVHGITGKVSNSYKANIDQVINYGLKAAFVQLNPLGTPDENGRLLKRMIDRITAHYGSATVSIVAHSKGGMDTERALYGRNPYNTSIPSFGYEKVDGVYTFSSPLRGARVADVGAALSWTGVAFIAMWYANGYQLTSGSVNSFHNWAKSWRINSYSTFKNAYHPNGASYSRINMIEDNTTRWWAHQSDDACYQNIWYYCYVGNAFHHSAGAYYDAYWQWAGFHSGWRNWHTSNDGFISEYRAKRSVITNHDNELTPGAGDYNWRVMQSANHTSLWEINQNHFSNEVAPYLHYGLYGDRAPTQNYQNDIVTKHEVDAQNSSESILGSNGYTYFGTQGTTDFIVEEDNQPVNLIFYTDQPIDLFSLTDSAGQSYNFNIIDSKNDTFTASYQSVAHIENLPKGVYNMQLPAQNFVVMAAYDDTSAAFAVNLHFDEKEGYDGQQIEVAIAHQNNLIDMNNVEVTATVNLISSNGEQALPVEKITRQTYHLVPIPNKPGHFVARFNNLHPGAVYGLRVEAKATEGEALLARNVLNTFYVKQNLPEQPVYVTNEVNDVPSLQEDLISLYPNPATEYVFVSVETDSPVTVSVYNTAGILIREFAMKKTTEKIEVKDWTSGIYMVRINSASGSVTKKMVVK